MPRVRDPRLEKLLAIIDLETTKLAGQAAHDTPLDLDSARTLNAYIVSLTRVMSEKRQATKAITADLSKLTNEQLESYARDLGFRPGDLLKDSDDDQDQDGAEDE